MYILIICCYEKGDKTTILGDEIYISSASCDFCPEVSILSE